MSYYNRYFSTFWGIFSFFSVIFWLVLKHQFSWDIWVQYTESMLLLYLIYNSRALRHKQSMMIWMGIGILIMGLIFKILHWPFSIELTIFGSLATLLAYYLFYLRRTQKKLLDTLKLLWVVMSTGIVFLNSVNINIPDEINYIKAGVLAFIYLYVSKLELNGFDQSELQEKAPELPEDIL